MEISKHNKDSDAIGSIFIQELDNLDCAIFDPSQGVIGQSWHVDLVLTGELDDQGFVYDFSLIKKLVKQVIKESVDHALLIPVGSNKVDFSESDHGEHWRLHAQCRLNQEDCYWEYDCPVGAVFPIRCAAISKKLVEIEINRLLKHRLPESIESVKIQLREEDADPTAAFFRYTHGITKHDGLCQRLFHGHKSLIEVFIGDERRPDLEHFVTQEIFSNNIHIATPKQIISGDVEIGLRSTSQKPVSLTYEASLGKYSAEIPANRILVVENETSIECLTRQIAQILKAKENPSKTLKVRLYEGIRKGAIVEI